MKASHGVAMEASLEDVTWTFTIIMVDVWNNGWKRHDIFCRMPYFRYSMLCGL